MNEFMGGAVRAAEFPGREVTHFAVPALLEVKLGYLGRLPNLTSGQYT